MIGKDYTYGHKKPNNDDGGKKKFLRRDISSKMENTY